MAADERIWTVGPDETGEVDEELLAHELLKLVGVLQRLGGGVSIIPRRREIAEGVYVTERVDIGWRLHAPLPRRARPQPAPVPVEVDEFDHGETDPAELEEDVEPAAVTG